MTDLQQHIIWPYTLCFVRSYVLIRMHFHSFSWTGKSWTGGASEPGTSQERCQGMYVCIPGVDCGNPCSWSFERATAIITIIVLPGTFVFDLNCVCCCYRPSIKQERHGGERMSQSMYTGYGCVQLFPCLSISFLSWADLTRFWQLGVIHTLLWSSKSTVRWGYSV